MDSSSSGGRSGRSNQNRSRGNRNQDRGSRQGGAERFPRPEPSPTIGQKILGFLGIGKKEEAPVEKPASRPPSGGGSGSDRSTGAQARKRVRKTQGPSSSERVPVSGTRLHVGNLNYDSTGEDLSGLFQEAGTVVSAEIVTNPHSGRSKGFAFVEMSSVDEARAVADKFHGQDFMGRDLVISGAKSKGPREGDRERPPRSRDRDGDRERRPRREEREDRGERRREDRPPRERKSRAEREQRVRGGSPPEGVERFDQAPKKVNVEQVSGARLTIENLDPEILKGDLIGLIGGLGTIVAHEITGGSATVELGSLDEAQRVVEVLNGKQFMGRQLKVSGATGDAPLAGAPASEPEPDAEAPAEETPAEETASDSSEPEPAAESESPAEEASEPEPAAEEAPTEPASPEPEPSFEEAVTEPITPEPEPPSEETSAPEAENSADEGSEEKPAAE